MSIEAQTASGNELSKSGGAETPSSLVAQAERPPTVPSDEDGLGRLFALLREQTKVDFTFYKPNTVLRRIERRMEVNQVEDLREYVRLLEARPIEVATLYRDLLIGVTSFFRDREVFEELGERILPGLFLNSDRQEIRFWAAGCSSGEEAYTLAILACECMERLQRSWSVKIFATDIDRDAIRRAGRGLYPESIASDMPPAMRSKYFLRRDDQYLVHPSIREMVVFAQHNLIKDPPFTNIELVSCRNLLIYLQPVLQQKVLEFLNFSLNPKGVLLLGTSEMPAAGGDFFEVVHSKFKIYRSKGIRRPFTDRSVTQAPTLILNRPKPAHFGRAAPVNRRLEAEPMLDRLPQGDINGEVEQRIHDLEQELQFTKENLEATIEELETSNEELQATNEQLLASNEALHTVNAECQARILELTEMTNDLENLMAATGTGALFLDENLEIRRFTPEIGRIFRILPKDLGRPLAHLTNNVFGIDIMSVLRRVETEKSPCNMEVRTLDGAWFLMKALPYQVGGGMSSGIVLTFTDIDPLKRNEESAV